MTIHISKELKRYNHLINEIDAEYHAMSLKFGMSDSAMIILYTICEKGDSCLLQDICQTAGISKQTINSALRKLEADGILYLEPAGTKNKRVCLTVKGKQLAEHTALKMIETENDIFSSWSEEDVEKYLTLTERYLLAFRERSRKMET
ncbi:MAG: MarR family transcriptional regulator [Lachnospiraceae bacterium]|nr:winged helix-turn-helix transcriptional regulator [Lachnospiraceae bacterium]MDE6760826.1 MarR family transcriptional regulator [Lachnospiraceae bacterium]